MFTGLIEELGTITNIEPVGDSLRLTVRGPKVVSDAEHGASISVNGTCLTVIEQTEDTFTADVMKQTVDMSAIADLKVGSPVNLERAAQAGTRLGGHIVQGHVDAVTTILEVRPGDKWRVLRFSLADDIAPLVAHKGSITLDGVSLTISAIGRDWAEVSLIPETLAATTLGEAEVGTQMNVETDILARQVLRLREFSMDGAAS